MPGVWGWKWDCGYSFWRVNWCWCNAGFFRVYPIRDLEWSYKSMSYETWHDSFTYMYVRCEFLASHWKALIMQTLVKAIFGSKGVLGEVFETENGFGFCHIPTQTTELNFSDFESALDAWHCFHDEWFENLPRWITLKGTQWTTNPAPMTSFAP